MKLILASGSPRRREILSLLNLKFDVETSQIDEDKIQNEMKNEPPAEIARKLSMAKSHSVAQKIGKGLVLGADTIVVLENQIFGKPKNEEALQYMMSAFSGKTHQVMTGVTMTDSNRNHSVSLVAVTDVTFRKIEAMELDWYVANANYLDKAGGYAIQEHAALFVAGIHGCYYNVVGLPVQETLALLSLLGYSWSELQNKRLK